MQVQVSTSLKRAKKIKSRLLVFIGLCVFFCAQAFGAPSKPASVLKEFRKPDLQKAQIKEKEIDSRVGVVIWKNDKIVGLNLSSAKNFFSGWSTIYYACDARMNLVAILIDLGISHKNCSMFMISEGDVELGDNVFVKFIPPDSEKLETLPNL